MKIIEIKSYIQTQIDHEQIAIDVHDHLVKILPKFEGKPVSKRIATFVNGNLPKGFIRAEISHIASMTHLNIIAPKYDDTLRFLLCYDSDTTFRIGHYDEQYSGFTYYNNCYGNAAKERNKERENVYRQAIKIAGIANSYAIAKEQAKQAHDALNELVHFSVHTGIQRILGMSENK